MSLPRRTVAALAIAGVVAWVAVAASTSAAAPLAAATTGAATTAATAPVSASPDVSPPRLSHDVVPTSQAVELTLDPEQDHYDGRVRIALSVMVPTTELRFHARAMTLDTVTMRGPAGPVPVAGVERIAPDQARVRFAAALAPGDYHLTIVFHNAYNTRAVALYRVVTGGHGYLFTQFEDTEAREAFPCWDEPEFKIPWTVSLAVPAADLAVGNTTIARETRLGDRKRVEFKGTKPLPSYLIAIAVGPFETVPIPGMGVPGRVITVEGASAMAHEAAMAAGPIIRSLERYFGRPYPYEKLDLIAAPEFQYGAMENAGAIVFADRRLLIDPRSVDPDLRRSITSVIAHEMAHQWFGDLVTMKWWDDLWLNESFASWMATKVMDDVYPDTHGGVTALFSVNRALAIDSRSSTRAMREKITGSTTLGQTANELTYDKGQAVLTMFEGWLGYSKFRAGVLDYLAAHEWRNAEGSDLWRAMGRVSGDDIDAAMSSFLDQPGVPLVTIEPLPAGRLKIAQRRFFTSGDAAGHALWRIPVILRTPGRDSVLTHRLWLTGPDTTIDLGTGAAPAWVEPNADARGYYRWQVPDAMLDALAAAKRSLTVRERIELIANLTALLRAGQLHGDRYLALVTPLADDPSPEVVRSAIESLNGVRLALETPRARTQLATYLRGVFEPALQRFGMRPQPREALGVTLVRPVLLRLLADGAGDTRVVAYADSLGRAYRRDPASIPASLAETAILVGAEDGDRAEFDDYRHRFETTQVPNERVTYLAGLGRFQAPDLRSAALAYALTGPMRPQEALVIPGSMALSNLGSEGRGGGDYPDAVVDWVFQNFDALRGRLPPNFGSRIIFLGGGCSEERIATLRKFFDDPAHKVQGGDSTLRRLSAAIEECSKLNARESARVEHWLLERSSHF